jgi:hypothetical protein
MGDAYWRVGRQLEATFQWHHAIAGKPEPEDLVKIEEKLKKGLPDVPGQSSADATKPGEKKPDQPKPEEPKQDTPAVAPAPAAPAPEKPTTD